MLDHSLRKDSYKLYDDVILNIEGIRANFVKQEPVPKDIDLRHIRQKLNELDGLYFRQLTPKTLLVKLSNFSYVLVDRIEKLIEENKYLLEKSENLIVDLRDNGGGTDDAFKKLLPYINTNPTRYVGVEFLATQTLIDGLKDYLKTLSKDEKNQEDIERINKNIKLYEKNLGKFVNLNSSKVQIESIETAKKSPKRVVVLANKNVGSAAENLVLTAKQSKKVKILGTPTFGVLDYASARFFKFGCENYKLLLPTYRSLRLPDYPIDNIGIQPDVYLDDTVENWVDYAIKYLGKR